MSRPDFVVYIGRFQPFHNGHLSVLRQALSTAQDSVIVVLGSANEPRTIKNPFTAAERQKMISACLTDAERARVKFVAVENAAYNNTAWATDVVSAVDRATMFSRSVALIGFKKDASTFYLDLFPQWGFVEAPQHGTINATDIRNNLFNRIFGEGRLTYTSVGDSLPDGVYSFIVSFSFTEAFEQLCAEQAFIRKYRQSWEAAPYAPTFVTVDACVVQSGHVLLIERRAEPGKGLWALPGGFLNQSEYIEDAMIRELREETRLKVPDAVLRGSIRATKVFDAPDRSMRGRTITHAYLIHLQPVPTWPGLPSVKGSDDAAKAKWWPMNQVNRSFLFEDHYDLIRNLTARL